jgi:hypothetical protein
MRAADELGRIRPRNDLRHGVLHALKCLPVTARGERVAVPAVLAVRLYGEPGDDKPQT